MNRVFPYIVSGAIRSKAIPLVIAARRSALINRKVAEWQWTVNFLFSRDILSAHLE